MAADIKRLLESYNIEFVESGPNVAKGNINIQCPWCGIEDRSHHLGINLASGMWGCWRSQQHRGRLLSKLLVKLTGISQAEARRAAQEGESIAVQPDDYEKALSGLTEGVNTAESTPHSESCGFDPYMHKLTGRTRAQKRAVHYLTEGRGFPPAHVRGLARRYDLHFAIRGDFANRIVVPVYEQGILQTYLGRSIYKDAALRYRALDAADSVKQVKDCIYNFDNVNRPGRRLYIVEGAFDVFKIDFYNFKEGVCAVGLFNMNVESAQQDLLYELRDQYDEFVIVLDGGQVAESLKLEAQLGWLPNLRIKYLEGEKDPGDLTPKQAIALVKEVT